ncbi:MAG: AbrB/MazE/SpoVT family DNA-binding domain-containing protein [Actinomycetota bacterium]|nr:AbrB/MazE/SpoVT family DNA-binding domain-containing protein [Actinomycetota bacterium]
MKTVIDKAGRVVIPKFLREEVGLTEGEIEVTRDGAGIRIEPVTGLGLVERRGRLVIPADGASITDEMVRKLRDAGQR